MNAQEKQKPSSTQDSWPLPRMRPQIVTKDRQIVDTTGEVWRFRASNDGGKLLTIKWPALASLESPLTISLRAERILQIYHAYRLTFSKGMTVWNDFAMFQRFFRWYASWASDAENNFEWSVMSEEIFRAFLEHGLRTASKGNDFARLRDMYFWGTFGAQFLEFDPALALTLKTVRAQGNVRGAAVRFRDPLKGPLDQDEQQVVTNAVAAEAGRARDRAIVMLHLELGVNPQATARMKNRDLEVFHANVVVDGHSVPLTKHQLKVPRVKKRKEFRETKTRPVSDRLGKLLSELQRGKPDDPLFHWLSNDSPEQSVEVAMRRFARVAGLVSPRTRARLRLTPRRFRYTLATEMAREGASREKIAEVLDHTDLQNVEVYIEATSYIVDQLGERFDQVFDRLLQRFRGKIVDSRTDRAFPGIPPKLIPGRVLQLPMLPVDVGGIGLCGRDVRKDGLCRLAPPLTCYPCEFFAAFRDGPHADVLARLERITEGMRTTADARIPRQLDGVIGAIRQLLAQIAQEAPQEGARR